MADAPLTREELVRLLKQAFPDPNSPPFTPDDPVKRVLRELHEGENRVVQFPPHLRKWFGSLSEDDVTCLNKLISLRPETVAWVAGKNEKELENLDGAVSFITSSRTAAKVLMWVGGMMVAFIGGVTALAKNGVDLFSIIRGGR